jgi:hypothetical protein
VNEEPEFVDFKICPLLGSCAERLIRGLFDWITDTMTTYPTICVHLCCRIINAYSEKSNKIAYSGRNVQISWCNWISRQSIATPVIPSLGELGKIVNEWMEREPYQCVLSAKSRRGVHVSSEFSLYAPPISVRAYARPFWLGLKMISERGALRYAHPMYRISLPGTNPPPPPILTCFQV